uniref:SKP1-like protein n=1 Tax=Leersia perrieri TaxID=77586 RepID=A0A0D9VDX9_9ORYZ
MSSSHGGGVIRTVTLRGSVDGARVRVAAATMAAASPTAKSRLDETLSRHNHHHSHLPDDILINVSGVSRPVLARVADYCDRHFPSGAAAAGEFAEFTAPAGYGFEDPLDRFDAELVGGADIDTVIDLLRAATFLRIGNLADLAAREVAGCMRGKKVEGIRKVFGIVNDYSKEEEEEVRKENSWAFDAYSGS